MGRYTVSYGEYFLIFYVMYTVSYGEYFLIFMGWYTVSYGEYFLIFCVMVHCALWRIFSDILWAGTLCLMASIF